MNTAEQFEISEKEFVERIDNTQKLARERELEGLVAISSYAEREGHVCYLTNHHTSFPNSLTHIGLGFAAVVLPVTGKPILVAPMGYQKDKVVGIEYAKTGFDYVSELVVALKERNLEDKRIGIAGLDVLPVEYYNRLTQSLSKATFVDANDILETQRLIKSPAERRILREAAKIASEGLKAGMESVREGVRECDVALAARKAAREAGADYIVRVRVASRERMVGLAWPMNTRKVMRKGEFVYLDFIGWFQNYGFDTSRVSVVGDPTEEQAELLEAAIEATDWMIETMKPGMEKRYAVSIANEKLVMPLAHHIGIDIVETWAALPGSKTIFKPGMVLCVEPAVTDPKLGSTLNVEDEVVITENGAEIITNCPRVFWK